MASFTVYDPKSKTFRALETTSESDLPFEQVLLINILLELRVIASVLSNGLPDPDAVPLVVTDSLDELRSDVVGETGAVEKVGP